MTDMQSLSQHIDYSRDYIIGNDINVKKFTFLFGFSGLFEFSGSYVFPGSFGFSGTESLLPIREVRFNSLDFSLILFICLNIIMIGRRIR